MTPEAQAQQLYPDGSYAKSHLQRLREAYVAGHEKACGERAEEIAKLRQEIAAHKAREASALAFNPNHGQALKEERDRLRTENERLRANAKMARVREDGLRAALTKVAEHERTDIMRECYTTDCSEADAFRECALIAREALASVPRLQD